MKPTAVFEGRVADMRKQAHPINYELMERNTRAVLREQSFEEGQASSSVDGFQPIAKDTFLIGWPIIGEECPYASLGMECDPVCVYCDTQHVCMHCALESRSAEARIDPPCPLRIPGCGCSTGAGPSVLEYYRNNGDPFMSAYVQGAGDKEVFEEEIEDGEYSEEAGEEDVIEEETEDDGYIEDSGNEILFKDVGGEEPLDDENEGDELVDDGTLDFFTPQSLWPLSPTFWKGLVPGWKQGPPPPPPPQVDCNDYSAYLREPPTIEPQSSVAAGQHARGGRAHSSVDVLQYPMACNGYSAFVPVFPGLTNQEFKTASQNAPAGKVPPFSKPVVEGSRPEASHRQEAGHNHAAVGESRPSKQPASKKDSRGWEEHEKAIVKTLMEEVILEGTYAQTEERWKVISRRLSNRYSVDRTWTAVKNYWNRHGRSDTNIDERKVKKPDRMITGVQDPESRRKARNLKRKDAERNDGNDLVDLEDDDDYDSAPSSKRLKL